MIHPKDKLIPPTFYDVLMARRRIAPYLRPTPTFNSPLLDDTLGFSAHVKCENLQPIGAFKVRGGINLMSILADTTRERGVVTASSGNHGQSIAYAGALFGVPVRVYVPAGSEPLKIRSMQAMGAEVVVEGRDYDEAREATEAAAVSEDKYFVHTCNEPHLIAGVATATLELLEVVPDLDVLIVPIGGGSCACGAGLVAKTVNPAIRVIGVQAEGADAVYRSWRSGRLETVPQVDTFAGGLATRVAFELPLQMLRDLLDDFLLVSDEEMIEGIKFLMDMTHQVAEGAGAASTAAALRMREDLAGMRVGIMLSGGNIGVETLAQLWG
ncbi:MAG: threonine/serine dehydratase [Clostridia bacterium]